MELIKTIVIKDKKRLDKLKQGFKCIRCGNCCKIKAKLEDIDINRIKKVNDSDFYTVEEGRYFLKLINHNCIFYSEKDKKGFCKIYNNRPEGCRKYPFFGEIVMECPVIKV